MQALRTLAAKKTTWIAAATLAVLAIGTLGGATGGPQVASLLSSGGDEDTRAAGSDGCAQPCVNLGLQSAALPGLPGELASGAFDIISTGGTGAEPTIGVSPDGTAIYAQYGVATMRSTDSGATWSEIGPVYMNQETFDPMLYYDPVIDRLYVLHLTIECDILAWTDKPATVSGGQTGAADWKVNPQACGLPGLDHPKLEGGPSAFGQANEGRTLYLGYSQAGGGAIVAKSVDGGFGFVPVLATASLTRGTFLWPTGPVVADPAGNYVYMAHHTPASGLMVAYSSTEGISYGTSTVTLGYGASGPSIDAEIAVDASGTVYAIWWSISDYQIYYSYSTNHGMTWSTPTQVTDDSDTKTTIFPAAVAGSDGKVDIAFLGTTNSSAGPDNCPTSGASRCLWSVYMAQITSADSASPTIAVTQVTPDEDPVQIGAICTAGLDCATGRNLLDFIDIEADDSGYAHIAYADGCASGCGGATTGQSNAASGRYARQTSGSTI